MKEIYRSFDAPLGVNDSAGYIILENETLYEVVCYSCYSAGTTRFRVPKDLIPEFTDVSRIMGLMDYASQGEIEGSQFFHHGRWYKAETIERIKRAHLSSRWTQFVRDHRREEQPHA